MWEGPGIHPFVMPTIPIRNHIRQMESYRGEFHFSMVASGTVVGKFTTVASVGGMTVVSTGTTYTVAAFNQALRALVHVRCSWICADASVTEHPV